MTAPTLCLVYNNVDQLGGIGKLCVWAAESALEAGWHVTVIAREIDADLRPHVEWIRFPIPRRSHALQWFSATPAVAWLMRDRRWDVVHVQQPQLAPLANVLQLHYLAAAARERTARDVHRSSRRRRADLQVRLTTRAESAFLSRLPRELTLMPVSEYARQEFIRLYGRRQRTTVVPSPAPAVAARPTQAERQQARGRLAPRSRTHIIGFLGGADPRKGGRALLDAVMQRDDTTVLWAGAGRLDHPAFADPSRCTEVGYQSDPTAVYDASTAFAAVSSFDPGPLTALEAAARGTPVLGTKDCGFVVDLADRSGAVLWEPGRDLGPALEQIVRDRERLVAAADTLLSERSRAAQTRQLLDVYAASRPSGHGTGGSQR